MRLEAHAVASAVAIAIAIAAAIATPAAASAAGPAPPAVGVHATQLDRVAGRTVGSLGELTALLGRPSRSGDEVRTAAENLALAAADAGDVLGLYRSNRVRDCTLAEFGRLRSLDLALLDATVALQRVAARPPKPASSGQRRAARRAVDDAHSLVVDLVGARLGDEGIAELLRAPNLRTLRAQVVRRLDARIERELRRRLPGFARFGLPFGVSARTYIADAGELLAAEQVTRLTMSFGPALMAISLLTGGRVDPVRLVRLVGRALREGLRNRGNVDARTARTLASLGSLAEEIGALDDAATLSRVRRLANRATTAVAATRLLEADLRRAGRTELLGQLTMTRQAVADFASAFAAIAAATDCDRNLARAQRLAGRVRDEAARIAAAQPQPTGPPDVTAPTAGVCVPASFTMESRNFSGQVTGTYQATFSLLRNYSTYERHCLWNAPDSGEAFIVTVNFTPERVPGALPAGDCGHTSPSTTRSDARHLSVGGGTRREYTNAQGGDVRILESVLRAAEAAGVGQPC